jgi:hypothetical protein
MVYGYEPWVKPEYGNDPGADNKDIKTGSFLAQESTAHSLSLTLAPVNVNN